MLQRIQTLWMLLSLIAMVTFSFVNFLEIDIFGQSLGISVIDLTHGHLHDFVKLFNFWGSWVLGILTNLNIILIIVSISLFKKRILQARFLTFATILTVFIIVGILYVYFRHRECLHYSMGNMFPFISIILNILAIRRIYFDEALVRSMNRLR